MDVKNDMTKATINGMIGETSTPDTGKYMIWMPHMLRNLGWQSCRQIACSVEEGQGIICRRAADLKLPIRCRYWRMRRRDKEAYTVDEPAKSPFEKQWTFYGLTKNHAAVCFR